MKYYKLNESTLAKFQEHLMYQEKSGNTIQKYSHDIRTFLSFLNGRLACKEIALAYKEYLTELYAVASVNSMLAALNTFMEFVGFNDCKVKPLKVQRRLFAHSDRQLTRESYEKMVALARREGKDRLCMLMQTLCNTGIRISELPYITVDAVNRGRVTVNCKGKIREIFIHKQLQLLLIDYIQRQKIVKGSVFVTRNGKPIHRCNVWKEMQSLSFRAHVKKEKVFPHNLRHLFAYTYYKAKKDIAKLADILGHSNIQTTRIYTMTSGIEHRRELAGLGLLITDNLFTT